MSRSETCAATSDVVRVPVSRNAISAVGMGEPCVTGVNSVLPIPEETPPSGTRSSALW
jgi:hypothetical protein